MPPFSGFPVEKRRYALTGAVCVSPDREGFGTKKPIAAELPERVSENE
jgi:hypothetical protein